MGARPPSTTGSTLSVDPASSAAAQRAGAPSTAAVPAARVLSPARAVALAAVGYGVGLAVLVAAELGPPGPRQVLQLIGCVAIVVNLWIGVSLVGRALR